MTSWLRAGNGAENPFCLLSEAREHPLRANFMPRIINKPVGSYPDWAEIAGYARQRLPDLPAKPFQAIFSVMLWRTFQMS